MESIAADKICDWRPRFLLVCFFLIRVRPYLSKSIKWFKAEENYCVFHVLYLCGCSNDTNEIRGASIKEESHVGMVERATLIWAPNE